MNGRRFGVEVRLEHRLRLYRASPAVCAKPFCYGLQYPGRTTNANVRLLRGTPTSGACNPIYTAFRNIVPADMGSVNLAKVVQDHFSVATGGAGISLPLSDESPCSR